MGNEKQNRLEGELKDSLREPKQILGKEATHIYLVTSCFIEYQSRVNWISTQRQHLKEKWVMSFTELFQTASGYHTRFPFWFCLWLTCERLGVLLLNYGLHFGAIHLLCGGVVLLVLVQHHLHPRVVFVVIAHIVVVLVLIDLNAKAGRSLEEVCPLPAQGRTTIPELKAITSHAWQLLEFCTKESARQGLPLSDPPQWEDCKPRAQTTLPIQMNPFLEHVQRGQLWTLGRCSCRTWK